MRGIKKRSKYCMDPRRAVFEVGDVIDVVWNSGPETANKITERVEVKGTLLITKIELHNCGKGSYVEVDGEKYGSFQLYTMQQLGIEAGREHSRIGISVVEDLWKAKHSKAGRILFAGS